MENEAKFIETEIGPIPLEWGVVRCGDILDIFTGKKDVNQTVLEGPYVFFSCSPDEYRSDDYLYDGKALIITGNGSYTGTVRYYEGKFDLYQRTYGVVLKSDSQDDWDARFLYYYFKIFFEREYMGGSRGSSIPYIVRGNIENFLIPRLPLDEQKRIAEILSSLDETIKLNRKMNKTLEEIAQALFKRWFVDFEFPDENGKPYKSSGGKMIDSELGLIPEGWRVGKVSDLIRIESGFPFNSGMFDESGRHKLVTIKNVQDGQFIPTCTDLIAKFPEKLPKYCILKEGDILLSLTGNVGRICIVFGSDYLLNQRVAILIPIDEREKAFTYLLFRQKEFQRILMGISRGTAQQNLSPIESRSLEIAVPNKTVLDDFGKISNSIYWMMVANLKQIEELSAVRDSLLPRLMSGKIRV
jgi:type I restriction enzyme, S subunit